MKTTALVSDIMTRYVTTVSPNMTADKIYELFHNNNSFHHLPVVDGEKLVGMISKIDVYRITHSIDLFHSKSNEAYNDQLLRSLLAEEIMTKDVVTLSPSDTVEKAAALFSQNYFHALPVVEKDKLVGIITTFDLIKHAYNEQLKPA